MTIGLLVVLIGVVCIWFLTPGNQEHVYGGGQLNQWLTVKPASAFFENTLHAISLVLAMLPSEQREASRQDLISHCTSIAASVGRRLLGLPETTKEEREVIKHIAEEIGRGREEKVRQAIGG